MQAIIFCAGAPQPHLSVLRDYPDALLVGVDGGAARLVQAGYAPDWAIGDFDTSEPPEQVKNILRLPKEKDDTDLQAALKHILCDRLPENVSEVVILGALGGGRLDHILCNIWLAHQDFMQIWLHKMRLVEEKNTLRFFQAGCYELQREMDKSYLSFIGLTPLFGFTLQDVSYPLVSVNFPYPIALISNEFSGSQMRFSLEKGLLAVLQTCD